VYCFLTLQYHPQCAMCPPSPIYRTLQAATFLTNALLLNKAAIKDDTPQVADRHYSTWI